MGAAYLMKIIEILKKRDRTLLEMHIGMLAFGIVCQIAGAFFVQGQGYYAVSLWFGVAFAFAGSIHMARTLDRALECGGDAEKLVTRGYLFRYIMIVFVLAVAAVTKAMDPLVVFLGYMSMKVAAYLQPFTHKLCNRLFSETDPVPRAEEEAAAPEEILPKES